MTPPIDSSDRGAWLAWRASGIGASDVPAILGLSPYKTPLDLYMDKIGQGTPSPETLPMHLGNAAESWILRRYCDLTGHEIKATQACLESAAMPYLRATLDAIRDDGLPVELKLILSRSRAEFGDEGSDELPGDFLVQGTTQLIVADAEVMDFAVACPQWPEVRIYEVRRDEALCRIILEKAAEFWSRVQARNPPPYSTVADIRHSPHLPVNEGLKVEFDDATAALWRDYELLGEESREASKARDAAKVRLFNALGEASQGVFPDGSRLVRKVVERKEYTCKASTYSTLQYKKGE